MATSDVENGEQMLASKPGPGLLLLPPEVRHQIYRYLFCHRPSPITLGFHDFFSKWASFSPFDESQEPTFYTALFRVSKAISHDTLEFAYSANSFRFDKDIETFCRLGATALASIKTLRVYKNAWLNSSYATAFWQTMSDSCSGLELLTVEAASHVCLTALPYLKDFMASIDTRRAKPKVILDLTVLDRHFSFDFPDREYTSTLKELTENMQGRAERSSQPQYLYVMRLPKHVHEIRFVMDIGPGAYRALDEVLSQATHLCQVKLDPVSAKTTLGVHGRGKRMYFNWQEPE
jgi:hypothetical protein